LTFIKVPSEQTGIAMRIEMDTWEVLAAAVVMIVIFYLIWNNCGLASRDASHPQVGM